MDTPRLLGIGHAKRVPLAEVQQPSVNTPSALNEQESNNNNNNNISVVQPTTQKKKAPISKNEIQKMVIPPFNSKKIEQTPQPGTKSTIKKNLYPPDSPEDGIVSNNNQRNTVANNAPLNLHSRPAPFVSGATLKKMELPKASDVPPPIQKKVEFELAPIAEASSSQLASKSSNPISVGSVCMVGKRKFSILSLIGKGGSSLVFSALSLEDNHLTAIKHVKGKEHVTSLVEEIELLKRLKENAGTRDYIVNYIAHEVLNDEEEGLLVMELGQNDLNQFVIDEKRNGGNLSKNLIRYLWESMLDVVHSIHEARIVHGDLKPANFVFVKGKLKLIDFGIAKGIPRDDTINITRDTQTGTLNYIPPEALLPSAANSSLYKLSVKADVWSLGCILYGFVYGSPPFHDVVPWAKKIAAILNENHQIKFLPNQLSDAQVIDVLQKCLQRSPSARATIAQLKAHAYLSSAPSSATPRGIAELIKEMAINAKTVAELRETSVKALAVQIVKNLSVNSDVNKAVVDAIDEIKKREKEEKV